MPEIEHKVHLFIYMYNTYMQALDNLGEQLDIVYALVMHEIIHALGFSSSVFHRSVKKQRYTTIMKSDCVLKVCGC